MLYSRDYCDSQQQVHVHDLLLRALPTGAELCQRTRDPRENTDSGGRPTNSRKTGPRRAGWGLALALVLDLDLALALAPNPMAPNPKA